MLNQHVVLFFLVSSLDQFEIVGNCDHLSSSLITIILLCLQSRGIWNPGVGCVCLLVAPVVQVLGPGLPFFFTTHDDGLVGSLQQVLGRLEPALGVELLRVQKGRLVGHALVGSVSLSITPVIQVLGPSLPLFFALDQDRVDLEEFLGMRQPRLFSLWVKTSSIDQSALVRNSRIGGICLLVAPVVEILSPSLPFLLAADDNRFIIKLDGGSVGDSAISSICLVVRPVI